MGADESKCVGTGAARGMAGAEGGSRRIFQSGRTTAAMERYHYPTSSLVPDYARVAIGLGATLGPLIWLELAPAVAIFLAVLAGLFIWFGLRTAIRQQSWIELSPETIRIAGPFGRQLDWRALERLQLAYFAPRRARREGWLQLTLRGPDKRPMRLDSTLAGFDRVLQRALAAATARPIELDPTTLANLAAIGLDTALPPTPVPPGATVTPRPPNPRTPTQGAEPRAAAVGSGRPAVKARRPQPAGRRACRRPVGRRSPRLPRSRSPA